MSSRRQLLMDRALEFQGRFERHDPRKHEAVLNAPRETMRDIVQQYVKSIVDPREPPMPRLEDDFEDDDDMDHFVYTDHQVMALAAEQLEEEPSSASEPGADEVHGYTPAPGAPEAPEASQGLADPLPTATNGGTSTQT